LSPTKNMLNRFKDLKDDEINFVCDSTSKRMYNLFQKNDVAEQIRDNEVKYNFKYSEQEIERIIDRVKKDNKERLAGDFRNVRSMLQSISEEQFNSLAKQLAYPRGQRVHDQATYQTYLRARKLTELMHSLGKNNLDLLGLDLNSVKNFFVGNLSKSSAKYLKTPSVIVTYNDMRTTGGHNLSSKISRVNSMQNYKRDGGGGVYYAENKPQPTERSEPTTKSEPTTNSGQPTVSGERKPTPSSGAPTTSKPKPITTTTASSAPAPKPAAPANIRPRTEVISGGDRAHRGF